MNQILIYSETMHPRLLYVLSVLDSYTEEASFQLTSLKDEFKLYSGPSINYSSTPIKSNELFIKNSGSLYQNLEQFIEPAFRKSTTIFQLYPESEGEGFDLFAAVFYLLARVEEYQKNEFDKHHRFAAASSILFRNGVLQQAVVDAWIFSFINELELKFNISLPIRIYNPLWSLGVDIDQFYKHKYKSAILKLAGSLRDFAYGKYQRYLERMQIYCGLSRDPYDSMQHFSGIPVQKNQLTFFILSGGNSSYDKNHSLKLKPVIQTLNYLKTIGEIGLHPSYNSMEDTQRINEEKRALEKACDVQIKSSRQHFLRLHIEKTYPALIQNNILTDFSMGFADQPGFRAGTCRPFYWYDLRNEKQTNLFVIPLCCMDRTYLDYLKFNPAEAQASIIKLFNQVKKYGGHFHLTWHNSSFDFNDEWKAWEHVLNDLIVYFNQHSKSNE